MQTAPFPGAVAPFVTRLLPLIAKLELFAPLVAVHPPWVVESDKEPEKAGEEGDIATLIVPTTVPEGEPPTTELFDRETDEIDCETAVMVSVCVKGEFAAPFWVATMLIL